MSSIAALLVEVTTISQPIYSPINCRMWNAGIARGPCGLFEFSYCLEEVEKGLRLCKPRTCHPRATTTGSASSIHSHISPRSATSSRSVSCPFMSLTADDLAHCPCGKIRPSYRRNTLFVAYIRTTTFSPSHHIFPVRKCVQTRQHIHVSTESLLSDSEHPFLTSQ